MTEYRLRARNTRVPAACGSVKKTAHKVPMWSVLMWSALCVLWVGDPTSAHAQGPTAPDAATVASWVQTFYDQTGTMTATFEQRYVRQAFGRAPVDRGTVRFKKPGKMRFDYRGGKVIVTDGEQLTMYEPPERGERRGQFYRQRFDASQLPMALGFLTGTGRLDRDFHLRLLSAQRYGARGVQVLELRSRSPEAPYARVLLFVHDDSSRRGVVRRVLIVDHEQNRNRFDFTEQRFGRPIGDQVFRWRPPRGARRVQP